MADEDGALEIVLGEDIKDEGHQDVEDSNDDNQSQEHKPSRAEKRIKALIKQRNQTQGELEELKSQLKELREQMQTSSQKAQTNDESQRQLTKYASAVDNAKEALVGALEEGDTARIADAQAKLVDAQTNYTNTKNWIEWQLASGEEETPQQQKSPQQTDRAKMIANLPPDQKKWFSANEDWYGVDQKMTNIAMKTFEVLNVEEGLTLDDGEEFWKEFDSRMLNDNRMNGWYVPVTKQDVDEEKKSKPKRAPVGKPGGNVSKNKVRLSASQQEIARALGISNEEYAKYKAKQRG